VNLLSELKKVDPDRFFLSLFAHREKRNAVMSLNLFYHEVSKTPDLVNEKAMGLIRFQWWRDEIEKLFSQLSDYKPPHVCLPGLTTFPYNSLLKIIDSCEQTLDQPSFKDIQSLKQYLLKLYFPIFDCLSYIDNQSTPYPKDKTHIETISAGWGIMQMIRSIPFMISQGYHMIPVEVLQKHGITKGYITPETDNLNNCIEDLHSYACEILNSAQIPNSKTQLYFYKCWIDLYLKEIKKHNYNVFIDRIHKRPAWAELKIIKKILIG
jgi:phytoene/squalene synthetase